MLSMRRHLRLRWAVLPFLLAALLGGCGKPIPPEKAAYVGQWDAMVMALVITQEGRVVYRRLNGSGTTSVEGPLKEFQGNNFVVGIGPLSTTFVVSAPPHQDGGLWKMTVDGVELTRK